MKPKTYSHIFIDLDDTLWDHSTNAKTALIDLYNDFNLNSVFNNFEEYHSSYFKRNDELWELYHHGKIKKDELVVERFLHPIRQKGYGDASLALSMNDYFLNQLVEQTQLIAGARELLDYLQPRYSLSIISNGFVSVQYKKMDNTGISHYFEQVILSEHVGVNKPHPMIFSYALSQVNANVKSSIMIGDNPDADILGARNANMDQIYFNPNLNDSVSFTPTHTVRSLIEIKDIL